MKCPGFTVLKAQIVPFLRNHFWFERWIEGSECQVLLFQVQKKIFSKILSFEPQLDTSACDVPVVLVS